jgi:hypothetical protein
VVRRGRAFSAGSSASDAHHRKESRKIRIERYGKF